MILAWLSQLIEYVHYGIWNDVEVRGWGWGDGGVGGNSSETMPLYDK